MLKHALNALLVPVLFATPTLANGLNLLTNPGFERPSKEGRNLPGWTQRKRPQQVTLAQGNVREGKFCVRMDNGEAEHLHDGSLMQQVTIEEGFSGPLLVEASGLIEQPRKAKKHYAFGVSFSCRYVSGRRKVYERGQEGFRDPAKEGWQDLRFVWTPPEPLKKLSVRLGYWHRGAARSDRVRVTPIRDIVNNLDQIGELDPDLAKGWWPITEAFQFSVRR